MPTCREFHPIKSSERSLCTVLQTPPHRTLTKFRPNTPQLSAMTFWSWKAALWIFLFKSRALGLHHCWWLLIRLLSVGPEEWHHTTGLYTKGRTHHRCTINTTQWWQSDKPSWPDDPSVMSLGNVDCEIVFARKVESKKAGGARKGQWETGRETFFLLFLSSLLLLSAALLPRATGSVLYWLQIVETHTIQKGATLPKLVTSLGTCIHKTVTTVFVPNDPSRLKNACPYNLFKVPQNACESALQVLIPPQWWWSTVLSVMHFHHEEKQTGAFKAVHTQTTAGTMTAKMWKHKGIMMKLRHLMISFCSVQFLTVAHCRTFNYLSELGIRSTLLISVQVQDTCVFLPNIHLAFRKEMKELTEPSGGQEGFPPSNQNKSFLQAMSQKTSEKPTCPAPKTHPNPQRKIGMLWLIMVSMTPDLETSTSITWTLTNDQQERMHPDWKWCDHNEWRELHNQYHLHLHLVI